MGDLGYVGHCLTSCFFPVLPYVRAEAEKAVNLAAQRTCSKLDRTVPPSPHNSVERSQSSETLEIVGSRPSNARGVSREGREKDKACAAKQLSAGLRQRDDLEQNDIAKSFPSVYMLCVVHTEDKEPGRPELSRPPTTAQRAKERTAFPSSSLWGTWPSFLLRLKQQTFPPNVRQNLVASPATALPPSALLPFWVHEVGERKVLQQLLCICFKQQQHQQQR